MNLDQCALIFCHLPDDQAGALSALQALKLLKQSFKQFGESCLITFPVEFDDVVEKYNLYSEVAEV